MASLTSCQDDDIVPSGYTVVEGLPATAQVTVCVDAPDEQTRSIIDEDGANYVEDLWIGAYNAADGTLLGNAYLSDINNYTIVLDDTYEISVPVNLKSANSVYIVAVANVGNLSASADIDHASTKSTLLSQLNAADTFDKFKAIYAIRNTPKDVNIYQNTLTMSGWFAATKPNVTDIEDLNIQPITITPGDNDLTKKGVIYLKRLISYNKFIVKAGPNVTMSLTSWQVCNIPTGCPVYEVEGNAADKYTGSTPVFVNGNVSHYFTQTVVESDAESADVTTTATQTYHSFEFYQFENKHKACEYKASADGTDYVGISATGLYNDREREFKNADTTNTSIYKSLVSSPTGDDLWNNNASYVVLKADLDYYVEAPEDMSKYDPNTAVPVDPTQVAKSIHRRAEATYVIHLGYCENKNADGTVSEATAEDFNCRRNTKYTYTVTINGVQNIVVEARNDKEEIEGEPGAEGYVSDETGDYEDLDSHYCEFNICLTDEERNKLSYRITSPYDGRKYVYTRDKDGKVTKTEGMNEELYHWIKFYPTSDRLTLAKYNGGKGSNTKNADGDALWTFDDMCAPTVKASPYDADAGTGEKWYTVFVDEYVYHFDDQGGVESSWPKYVNQDNRLAEFIMNVDISPDKESQYSYCKYAFGQRSIQTYYKENSATAIGVEHIDETYCLNMGIATMFSGYERRQEIKDDNGNTIGYVPNSNYNEGNSRYNVWYYLYIYRGGYKWTDVIDETVPDSVREDSNQGCSHVAVKYPVYQPHNVGNAARASGQPSPNDPRGFYANTICMNRNRDLDGNNDIDAKEIRWYLPTSSCYLQIAIAQGELPSPLVRFTDFSKDYILEKQIAGEWDRSGTFNFHFITADYQYYWGEQAISTGDTPLNGNPATQTYSSRCVRNLGTNLNNIAQDRTTNEVDYAFTFDSEAHTFTQDKFVDGCIRGYSPTALAPHDLSEPTGRPSYKFEYAKHICKNITDDEGYVSVNGNGQLNFRLGGNKYQKVDAWTKSLKVNSLCGKYTQEEDESDLGTWRVPTFYEMALMWIEDIPQSAVSMESGYASINNNEAYFLSGTHAYFYTYDLRDNAPNNRIYMGYNDYFDRKVLADDIMDKNLQVRCVRDLE